MDRTSRLARRLMADDKEERKRAVAEAFDGLARSLRFKNGYMAFEWSRDYSSDGRQVTVAANLQGSFPVYCSSLDGYLQSVAEAKKAYDEGVRKFAELGRRMNVTVRQK